MWKLPSNLTVIDTTDKDEITAKLRTETNGVIHATNGTYMAPLSVLFGTTASGFIYVYDYVAHLKDVFMIAVNSDASLENAGFTDFEPQLERALKVAIPLASLDPDQQVVVTYYDEETPTALYNELAHTDGIQLASLHKWGGYGIAKDAPVIEGAELFERTFAFPFYNADQKPAFFDKTRVEDQSDKVEVVDLHRTRKNLGKPYLDASNKPLFLHPNLNPQDFFKPKP